MTAEQLLKLGDLDGALDALQDAIRKAPQDARLRVFLFQLLCVQSQWKRAFEAAAASPGNLNEIAFSWIADADPRLGPLLEVIANGRYFWVPFTAISRIAMKSPVDLRDRVWMPANVTWSNGGDAIVLIPTRYAGTVEAAGNRHRLALATDWLDQESGSAAGVGQRLLATDTGECALMDLRDLTIGQTGEASADHG